MGYGAAELDGIRQKVHKHLLQQRRVCKCIGEGPQSKLDGRTANNAAEVAENLLNERGHCHTLLGKRLLSEARKAQQVIGQPEYLVAPFTDVSQEFRLLLIQGTGPAVAEELGKSDNSIQMPP